MTVFGGATADLFAAAFAGEVAGAPLDFDAWAELEDDVGAVAAAVPAVPPPPATVTTWAGRLFTLLPERPISTPTPIASSSVPMMAINVLLTDMLARRAARPAAGT
ncbi:MAG TPA: hypothetical protein VGW98_00685 [Solirubrobacteraceae bacterium]|nr:hypothetical protein [Solirubrobacteraceae bacterium]